LAAPSRGPREEEEEDEDEDEGEEMTTASVLRPTS
jgi:hypothetical protein